MQLKARADQIGASYRKTMGADLEVRYQTETLGDCSGRLGNEQPVILGKDSKSDYDQF